MNNRLKDIYNLIIKNKKNLEDLFDHIYAKVKSNRLDIYI